MSCCQCQGLRTVFDERIARRELERYRRKGPSKTTRILLEAVRAEGVAGGSLLDIGGGVGAISNELLEAGVTRADVVDASGAYLQAARNEAERRGNQERISFHFGDFVEVAPEIGPADVVTLDRVICCYDDMDALVSASAERARRLYALVYPRESWWNRFGVEVVNLSCRVRRNPFRAFVHSSEAVERVIRGKGLERRFHRTTVFWQVAVYGRA